VIPTLFLILGWGYQPERVQAGIYLLFYILLAFLPLLVGIIFVYDSLGSLCLFLLCGNDSLVGGLFYVCMVFAFLYVIRVPYIVASHLKILIPVGTAIIIVADVKYVRVSTSIPTVIQHGVEN